MEARNLRLGKVCWWLRNERVRVAAVRQLLEDAPKEFRGCNLISKHLECGEVKCESKDLPYLSRGSGVEGLPSRARSQRRAGCRVSVTMLHGV